MPRRLNTIIIVPHTKAKFVKISFSTRTFLLGVCGVLVALVLSAIAIAYTGSAVSRRAEVQRLDSENQQLVETNKQLQVTAAEVQARLEEFENQTARLALAAGMDTETVDPRVACGVAFAERLDRHEAAGGRGEAPDQRPEARVHTDNRTDPGCDH
jgi:hypothetical protein